MTEVNQHCLWSVEVEYLETEYERSKLKVYQDTLLCQKSILELELMCKKEELQVSTL